MLRSIARHRFQSLLTTLAAAGFFAACGGGASSGGPQPVRTEPCLQAQDGILSLSWTVDGQAPTSSACAGIDHLELFLSTSGCDVEISPVPCTLDRFRYDQLPDGPAAVMLDAVDGNGRAVGSGTAQVDLTATVPAAPVPLAITR
jgi:hypothetical protein